MMSLIWSAIVGLIVGAIAKFFMPGKDPGGIIVTILLGVGGSVVFTYLGRLIGLYSEGQSAGFIASVLGAMFLLWIYRMFKGKKESAGS